MPSPFPGMNPFLEQPDVWHDFHHTFLVAMREDLVTKVSPAYIAKIEEHLYIHEPPAETRRLLGRSDVSLTKGESKKNGDAVAATLEAPATVTFLDVEVERELRIEIRDRLSRQLVTVVELLSPTNKYAGPDRDQYEAKRGEIQASPVHLVEIDLLRGGSRMPMKEVPDCDYCVLVSRSQQRPDAGFWPLRLRDRLPVIPVPLKAGDLHAQVDLQELLHRVYEKSGYGNFIYANPPEPGLSKEDDAWAQQFIPRGPQP